MIYFRLCVSFSCSGYDLTWIKKSHTLNFYSFFLLLVIVVAQFTAKSTNSEQAIHLHPVQQINWNPTYYSHEKVLRKFCVFQFNVEKTFLLQETLGEGLALPCPLSLRSCKLPGKDPPKYSGLSSLYDLISPLTHFMPLISFDAPWKHQKTSDNQIWQIQKGISSIFTTLK